jgi:predicted RNA-binding Zn-ribbon protein involved in translation (DUF1610 family)
MRKERYMITGKDAKTGGIITGYYAFSVSPVTNRHIIYSPLEDGGTDKTHDVIPASLEPVAVKPYPIKSGAERNYVNYFCPNCDRPLEQFVKSEKMYRTTANAKTTNLVNYELKYCPECGQRLDWNADTPK